MQKFQNGVAIASAMLVASQTHAAMVGLEPVSMNNEINAQTAAAQIGFDFLDLGADLISGLSQVQITITNDGDEDSSVTTVMFDTDMFASVDDMTSPDDGVEFDFTNKKVLPGGKKFGFEPTAGLSIRSTAPVRPNGIDQGESLVLTLTMREGYDWSDLVDQIFDGSTRIGIHVQGFEDGGSETFMNELVLIPTPGAMGTLALAGLAAVRRRR
ncbi:MAG: hypothetical protein ACYTF7_08175 [Planctomycetota bacterium]|jgi:hypothetical protein